MEIVIESLEKCIKMIKNGKTIIPFVTELNNDLKYIQVMCIPKFNSLKYKDGFNYFNIIKRCRIYCKKNKKLSTLTYLDEINGDSVIHIELGTLVVDHYIQKIDKDGNEIGPLLKI